MLTYILYWLLGLCGGFLAANWIPPIFEIGLGPFISTLILDPITFFFGMGCFFVGFLANAALVRNGIRGTLFLSKGYKIHIPKLVISYLVIANFCLVFLFNLSIAVLFLIFSIVYGMISLDIRQNWQYDGKQEDL
ncbi:hypothetical protein ACFSCX_18855 [Bacillus salitolerans]|uniref:Uncharacterized protein n=1 Tax=Bacillus salitolerans TaxID=1437434 RepID=A0ABW4LTZ6_9BACI